MRTDLLASLATHRPDYFDQRLNSFYQPDYDDIRFRYHASVDLSRLVGMSHCEYVGLTWAELVGDEAAGRPPRLKRLDICLRAMADDPGYYLSRHAKKDWLFFKSGDDYFVTDGHHRCVVGRLLLELNQLPTTVHGVRVMEVEPSKWAQAQREGEQGGPPERWMVPDDIVAASHHDLEGELA